MRLAHLMHPDGSAPQLAVVDGTDAVFVADLAPGVATTLQDLIAGGDEALTVVRAGLTAGGAPRHPIADYSFASAVLGAPLIIAIGLNYTAHSHELGLRTDAAPTVFTLWPNSLSGHGETVSWPQSLSTQVDYEAELGVIIGRRARNVRPEDATAHAWGYTVVNDITARDIQFAEAQWSRCKSFDGFTPTGPVVVTADELPDPQDLRIWATVDDQIVQDASTSHMVRPIASLIAHLSNATTLLPGTLIATGSPGGAGYSRSPQIFLRDGTTVSVGVEGIGVLTTHCRVTP